MHIEHPPRYKASRGKFKKIEITLNIFSEHNAKILEVDYRGKKKTTQHMEAKQYVNKGPGNHQKFKENIKNT